MRIGNYDNFYWKQSMFGERMPKKLVIQVGHLLKDITLWIIWIERNDKVLNHEEWHESKMKHRI